MNKPYAEIFNDDISTVEDLINILKKVPLKYTINPMGQKCHAMVNHYHQCIHLDELSFLDGYKDELKEDITKIGDDIEFDVSDNDLVTYEDTHSNFKYSDPLYAIIGYTKNDESDKEEKDLYGIFSDESIAREAANELVEADVISRYELETPKLDEFGWK